MARKLPEVQPDRAKELAEAAVMAAVVGKEGSPYARVNGQIEVHGRGGITCYPVDKASHVLLPEMIGLLTQHDSPFAEDLQDRVEGVIGKRLTQNEVERWGGREEAVRRLAEATRTHLKKVMGIRF